MCCTSHPKRLQVTIQANCWGPACKIEMAEEWGKQTFEARRYHEETTRGSAFAYTNSNNTRGTVLSFYSFSHFSDNVKLK